MPIPNAEETGVAGQAADQTIGSAAGENVRPSAGVERLRSVVSNEAVVQRIAVVIDRGGSILSVDS